MRPRCGLVDPRNPCACAKMVAGAQRLGLVAEERLRFANHPTVDARRMSLEIDRLRTAAEVFRSHPDYETPEAFDAALRATLEGVAAHD